MPFTADDAANAAKKLGLQADIQAPGSPGRIDPDQIAKSQGLQLLPNNGNIQDGPSTAESLARGAAQGASLGFGDELSAAAGALVPTGTDKAMNRSYGDRYSNIKSQIRADNQKASVEHPIASALGEIAGATPLAIVTGGSSLLTQVGAASAIGALSSLGHSEDQSASDASKEALKTGAIAGGLAGILNGTFQLVTKGTGAVIKGPKESFKLSADMGKSLNDPAVAQQIGQEIDDVGTKFQQLSQSSRDQIGQNLETFASKTGTKVNPNLAIKDVVDKLDKFNPGRNVLAQNAKADLNDAVTKISQDLSSQADESGKVPFSALHQIRKTLSDTVFDQGLYQDNSYVDKLAKQLYRGVSTSLKQADSTGEYANMLKVYQSLSSSDPEAFSANAIKYLQDPYDLSARGRLGKVLGDLKTLSPDKQSYIPELTQFIDQDFQKAAIKAEVLKKVGGKTGALALKGISIPNLSSIASDMGASDVVQKSLPALNAIKGGMSGARGLIPLQGPIAGPTAGGLNVITSSDVAKKF